MKILGIDNVLFYVGNLTEAVAHYTQLGFHLRFHLEAK